MDLDANENLFPYDGTLIRNGSLIKPWAFNQPSRVFRVAKVFVKSNRIYVWCTQKRTTNCTNNTLDTGRK